MKFVLQHAQTQILLNRFEVNPGNPWTCIGFFFHDRGSFEQKSLVGMLRGLLYQILDRHQALWPCFDPTFQKLLQEQRSRSPVWDLQSLRECFSAIVKQDISELHLCLFLDALDEHEGDQEKLVGIVKSLTTHSNPLVTIKICLASRPWTIFKTSFGSSLGFKVHLHTYDDILAYSQKRLEDSLAYREQAAAAIQLREISERIAAKALGVFVWVRLVLDELSKGLQDGTPISTLENDVDQMPEELKDLYARTMKRVETRYLREGFAMMQVILCCKVPLNLFQLMRIIDTSFLVGFLDDTKKEGDQYIDLTALPNSDKNKASPASMARRLASRCGGLLEIASSDASGDERIVQFLHQTVKEFAKTYRPSNMTGHSGMSFFCIKLVLTRMTS